MSTTTTIATNLTDKSIIVTHRANINKNDMTPRTNYPTSVTKIMADTNLAFFVGPAGIGKTTLAKHCLGYRCLIVGNSGHYNELSLFNKNEYDGIIIHIPSDNRLSTYVNIGLLTSPDDRRITINTNYGSNKIIDIPASTKIIFTCSDSGEMAKLLRQFKQSCKIVDITNKPYIDEIEEIIHPRISFP